MAIGAATVWRIRPGGNDTNGAGYDSTISGAGTDYSQQDAPQLSLTDLDCLVANDAGRLKIGSATGGFTAAMIGNAIRISAGTGWVTGYYFITAVTSTNLCTLDRSPANGADRTGGTGKVGGAAITFQRLMNNANAVGDKVVIGNVIYMRGSGSDMPTVSDYADFTSFIAPVPGSSSGFVKLIGENGRPRFRGNGLIFNQGNYVWLENLYVSTTGTSNGHVGFFHNGGGGQGNNNVFINNVFNTNDLAGMTALYVGSGNYIADNYILNGDASPTSSSTSIGVRCTNFGNVIVRNRIEYMGGVGISVELGNVIENNIVRGCLGNSIELSNAAGTTTIGGRCSGNMLYGSSNGGHGIHVAQPTVLTFYSIQFNVIANHINTGKNAINIASGTAAANDLLKISCDYNAIHNNNGNYSGISAGAHDTTLSADPFVDAANGDFNINNDAGGGADLRAVQITLPG